jgi:hypothetical protein
VFSAKNDCRIKKYSAGFVFRSGYVHLASPLCSTPPSYQPRGFDTRSMPHKLQSGVNGTTPGIGGGSPKKDNLAEPIHW